MSSDLLSDISRRLHQATTHDDLIEVLNLLTPQLSDTDESVLREASSLIVATFDTLRSMTATDALLGERMIVEHLLRYLEGNVSFRSPAMSQLRDCLVNWYEQYPDQVRMELRERIISHLLERFHQSPSSSLCWTFTAIGYASDPLVTVLWNYVQQQQSPSEITDAALMALTTLGTVKTETQRRHLLSRIHHHMQGRLQQSHIVALDYLADPESLPFLVEAYDHLEHSLLRPLVLRVLATIAEASKLTPSQTGSSQRDQILADQVWHALSELYEHHSDTFAFDIALGGDIASRCDSHAVVPSLLRWFASPAGRPLPFPQVGYRLAECVRPHHLQGWSIARSSQQHVQTMRSLQQAACQDSQFEGRSSTVEMLTKEAAWETLLRIGDGQALEWFETAVGQETNGYLRGKLSTLFACFHFDPLPPTVVSWVTQPYNAEPTHPSAAELITRIGAIEITRSAATPQALEVLLRPGLRSQDNLLLASLEAVVEVALHLAYEGHIPVAELLLHARESHTPVIPSILSASALETLGQHRLFTPEQITRIVQELLNHEHDPQEQRRLIAAVSASGNPLPTTFLTTLVGWAQTRSDLVGRQAFATLADQGVLSHEEGLLQRLGLQRLDASWDASEPQSWSNWQSQVLGLLYRPGETTFLPALTTAIRALPWRAAHMLLDQLAHDHQGADKPPVPFPLVEAILSRIQQEQSSTAANLGLLERAGNLIPEAIALFHWDRLWNTWMPEARTALADALDLSVTRSPEAEKNAKRLLLLLAIDSQYAVRRAAYRALAQLDHTALHQACQAWWTSKKRDLRVLAAEACVWLEGPPVFETLSFTTTGEETLAFPTPADPALEHHLSHDPEPQVRKTYARARRERQKRLWAQGYLHLLLDHQTWSNQDVCHLWPYAEALKRVGDDSTLQHLHHILTTAQLPPHIRHWFRQIFTATKDGWQKATQKWPQPANMLLTTLEEGEAVLLSSNQKPLDGHLLLWQEESTTVTDTPSWGGMLTPERPEALLFADMEGSARLRLPDGREAVVSLQGMHQEASSSPQARNWITFLGMSTYP
jgi:hypothetical protein